MESSNVAQIIEDVEVVAPVVESETPVQSEIVQETVDVQPAQSEIVEEVAQIVQPAQSEVVAEIVQPVQVHHIQPQSDSAMLKDSAVLLAHSYEIRNETISNPRVAELESVVNSQKTKIQDLEVALAEARKIITRREDLLTQLQWKPKDDFYAYKNPQYSDKQVRDHQEKKLQQLIEQMRVMEKVLDMKDNEISVLSSSIDSVTDLNGSSPKISSPNLAAKMTPQWQRSPVMSPVSSPKQSPNAVSSPKPKSSSPRWWFGGRKDSLTNSGGLNNSSGLKNSKTLVSV